MGIVGDRILALLKGAQGGGVMGTALLSLSIWDSLESLNVKPHHGPGLRVHVEYT